MNLFRMLDESCIYRHVWKYYITLCYVICYTTILFSKTPALPQKPVYKFANIPSLCLWLFTLLHVTIVHNKDIVMKWMEIFCILFECLLVIFYFFFHPVLSMHPFPFQFMHMWYHKSHSHMEVMGDIYGQDRTRDHRWRDLSPGIFWWQWRTTIKNRVFW